MPTNSVNHESSCRQYNFHMGFYASIVYRRVVEICHPMRTVRRWNWKSGEIVELAGVRSTPAKVTHDGTHALTGATCLMSTNSEGRSKVTISLPVKCTCDTNNNPITQCGLRTSPPCDPGPYDSASSESSVADPPAESTLHESQCYAWR